MNLEELNSVRLFTLQRAVSALISTHPRPDQFADVFEQVSGMTQVLQIGDRLVSDDVTQEGLAFAQELIQHARDVAKQRTQPKESPED